MPDDIWDEGTAARYDDSYAPPMFAPEVLDPTVDFLADLAAGGRALEFAVGTGRVAIPLSRRGVEVLGIERSLPMARALQRKARGRGVEVVVGDMATAIVPGRFDLVYLVLNTLSSLTTQEQQVTCFGNAARHLRPGGRFVVETWVPTWHTAHRGLDSRDRVNQLVVAHHYWREGGGFRVHRSTLRYAWPSELDLMARLAGMRLAERWADWRRTPFTGDSPAHVSVWSKERAPT